MIRLVTLGIGIAASALLPTVLFAQPSSDGYDWARIGAVGNAPYQGFSDPLSPTYGRGGIGYEYKIGRTEVTTGQWLEFFNAALARPDPLPFVSSGQVWFGTPVFWGAERDLAYTGPGMRFRLKTNVAHAAMLPVSGISWRQAALLCNWLHNDKSTAQSAFMDGAYDATTFAPENGHPIFTDQAVRHPGARYWIPSLDEYLKAAYYDPNHGGAGIGGWWSRPNGTDTPLVYGPPVSFGGDGTGQANAGFRPPGDWHLNIPLGAYPTVQSPWGLLDLAGGAQEWQEGIWGNDAMYRILDGSARGQSGGVGLDDLQNWGSESPHWGVSTMGVRLASAVPAPGGFLLLAGSCVLLRCKGRRR